MTSMRPFEDIRIAGFDDKLSSKPDPDKDLYDMRLELSAAPPVEWEQIFLEERRFPRHTMWRRAWVEGRHIVIRCAPEELEQYHLRDLQEDVRNTNAKYREYLEKAAAAEQEEAQRQQEERERLADIKRRLGFD